ncbi:MAG: class I SAM-dependent methyltransferase [Candidatus Melainabacteria bacterium HGW-Melainabacteria-1]|nr:MAG: class I SAM-dependent methyltransferase [Candidatus Melainabacteria bacterium HGW-Melainabacteria-1]
MKDHFKDKAQDWDKRDMVRELAEGIGKNLLARVSLNPDMDVLDFGAGTGLLSAQLAPHVRRLVALDISEAMLTQLRSKPDLAEQIEVICHDLLAEPLPSRFDLIVSAMALHHVADTADLFERFAAQLKPGGHIALADLDAEDGSFHPETAEGVHHAGFTRELIAELLAANGFHQIHFETAHTVQKAERTYPVFLVTATQAAKPD